MDATTAVKLAAIAYCDDIPGSLSLNLPGWTAPWIAAQPIRGNTAFIGYDGTSQYAVAIRGSLLNFSWQAFDNWFDQDLDVLTQAAWTIGGDSSAKISSGANNGLTDLNDLADSGGTSMLTFLQNALTGGTSLTVAGHSLGGNLSTVLAPWLFYTLKSANVAVPMSVYTFAAPAAGNQSFANDYDGLFGSSSWRYQMNDDIVPMFPMPSQIAIMALYYSPGPQSSQISVQFRGRTVTLQEAIGALAAGVLASELANGRSYYTQTNQVHGWQQLTTSLCGQWQSNTIGDYFKTVACYHSIQNYAKAMGLANGVPCKSASGQLQWPDGLILP